MLDYNQGIWATTAQIEALGWLAVALVIFTTWKPLNAIWGAVPVRYLLYWLYQFLPTLLGISAARLRDRPDPDVPLVTIVVLVVASLRKSAKTSRRQAWVLRISARSADFSPFNQKSSRSTDDSPFAAAAYAIFSLFRKSVCRFPA